MELCIFSECVCADYTAVQGSDLSSSSFEEDADLFAERVKLRRVPTIAAASRHDVDSKTMNAFDLIGGGVDLSSMFEKCNDLVHR